MSSDTEHKAVLLTEAVSGLITDTDGLYIDGTFGRGGHASLILSHLSTVGRLMAIDKDPRACEVARNKFSVDTRFEIRQTSFANICKLVEEKKCYGKVTGVLLDLGVSSPQLDDPARGFSFLKDGPLDMRMDPDSGVSAADWLSIAKEDDIAQVLKDYGEERYSRRIARAIVSARADKAITRTGQLATIVKAANPAWEKDKHPATRAFQGIRIFINKELEDLKMVLPDIGRSAEYQKLPQSALADVAALQHAQPAAAVRDPVAELAHGAVVLDALFDAPHLPVAEGVQVLVRQPTHEHGRRGARGEQ